MDQAPTTSAHRSNGPFTKGEVSVYSANNVHTGGAHGSPQGNAEEESQTAFVWIDPLGIVDITSKALVQDKRHPQVTMAYARATSRVQRPLMSGLELTVSAPVVCTEIHVVNDALGIEAARSLLHEQLVALFTGAGVARRHITLLCDLLTLDGKPRGIRRVDAAADRTPLELAAFEEGRKAFTDAALRGWHGDEDSVQHAAVFNNPAQLGTGLITIAPTAAPVADDNQQATIWGHECDDSSGQHSCALLGSNDLTIFQAFDS